LLAPLYEAGWEDATPPKKPGSPATEADDPRILRRTCLVLSVSYDLKKQELTFQPAAHRLPDPDDGIGLYDAVPETIAVSPQAHGLVPALVEYAAADQDLLDPTRFTMAENVGLSQPVFLQRLYARCIGWEAAKWLGGRKMAALKRLDADDHLTKLMFGLRFLAPDVIPDPVPTAAAIGLTLDCWRHTEIENIHVNSKTLTDVVMAKISIATTRALRAHITTAGVDWEAVVVVLTDPHRRAANGHSIRELVGERWPDVRRDIEAKLLGWQHIANLAGPRATLRLLSIMGSTDYTKRWWGNSWWPDFASRVLSDVERDHPELLGIDDDINYLKLLDDVQNQPEQLPDGILAVLIDPPTGKGLRYTPVPMPQAHIIAARE
jgi:hypothetical protein